MKRQNSVKSGDKAILLDKKKSFREKLQSIKKEYGYLLLAGLIPAVLVYLIYLARGIHPFGDGTVLVLDLNGQYVYFFEALRDAIIGGGSLLYSWGRSMGGEFMGIYAYYLASPLSYLVCLFPKENIQEFLLVMFMIKTALCGGTMGFFLHKHSDKLNKLTVIAFSILYSMSAYCIVQQNNTMWIDAVMWLPLVAYSVEQLIKYGKYKLYVIALAMTLLSNYYIGYMVCIFVLLYYFFYLFAYKDNNANNPLEEKRHFLKSFVRIGFFTVIAIAISAVIVLCAYYSLQFGKNEFSTPNWEIVMKFDFFDLFFKLLPGSYDTVRIDGLPFVYCGLLTVILVPLFFCSKKFTLREKIFCGVFLFVLVCSLMISTLDLIWHGFQKPTWLNARYSFIFCFFLVFLAFKAMENIEEFSAKTIACVSAFILFFVVILQQFAPQYEEKLQGLTYGSDDFVVHEFATILLSIACLIAYVAIVAAMKSAKNKELVSIVLICVICVEVYLSGLMNINDLDTDVGYTEHYKYSEYNELLRPVTDTLDSVDSSFYRMEKTYHRKYCDNMALGIRGVSNSTSTLNKDTIEFLNMLGYYSQSHKSQYKGGNPVSDSLLGMKYIISERDYSNIYGEPFLDGEDYAEYMGVTIEELQDMTYSEEYKKYSSDDILVYYNPNALSIAFAADDAVLDVNMLDHNTYVKEGEEGYNPEGYTSPFTRLNAYITAILGEDELVEVFKSAEQVTVDLTNCTHKISSTGHDLYKKSGDGDAKITYTYSVPEGVQLYLFFPAHYNREIKLSSSTMSIFDGTTKLDKCNDRIVELGYTEKEEYKVTVTINNSRNEFYTKPDDSFIYYVDMEALESAFSKIQQNQFIIDDKYTEDKLTGTITVENDDQLILTTIPYDSGWKVYVDGEKVETFEASNALVAFRIDDAGEHDLKIVYRSTPFVLGLIISIIGLAAFVCIIVFEDKLKKIKPIRTVFSVEEPQNK